MGALIAALTICFLLMLLFLLMWLSEVKEHRGARQELESSLTIRHNEHIAYQSETEELRKAKDLLEGHLEITKIALQVAVKRLEKYEAKDPPIKARSWHQIRVLNDAENKKTELEEINKRDDTSSRT